MNALLELFVIYWDGIIVAVIILSLSYFLVIPPGEEKYDPDWWSTLERSPHYRLCLPPQCIKQENFTPEETMKTVLKRVNAGFSHKKPLPTFIPEELPDYSTPLLCFVNSRSGGYQGNYVMNQLRRLLNPLQVVDLAQNDPVDVLRAWSVLPSLRVLACGGDGTVLWILNSIEQLSPELRPALAILPLGTGNDLARVLGWGQGANDTTVPVFLQQIQKASITSLDRWKIIVKNPLTQKVTKSVTFNNYFGVGVDAQIVLKFHTERERSPERFFSQFVNKVWYGVMGWQEIWRRECAELPKSLMLTCYNGDEVEEIELPEDTQGIVFSNIPSYGGGAKLWHNDRRTLMSELEERDTASRYSLSEYKGDDSKGIDNKGIIDSKDCVKKEKENVSDKNKFVSVVGSVSVIESSIVAHNNGSSRGSENGFHIDPADPVEGDKTDDEKDDLHKGVPDGPDRYVSILYGFFHEY